MDEEQILFEQLTLNKLTIFTKWEYQECGVFVSVSYFWVNSTGCSDEFHDVFKHFQNLENVILNILKEKLCIAFLALFFRKTISRF